MLDQLRALIGRLRPTPLDPGIEQLLAHAIEQIDPRLKAFGNYPRAYRPAISTAADYAASLADTLPDFIDLSPGSYASEPLLHALFGDVETIYSTVRDSSEIRHYCQQYGKPAGGELFALMGMRRHEKCVFGHEMRGDVVQQDVKQTMVYFEGHTLTLPAPSREAFREKLERHFFDSLIHSFAEQLAQTVARRHELETQRDILLARLRSEGAEARGLEQKLQAIRHELSGLESEFALQNYSRLINAYIDKRHDYLRIEQQAMPIDMRGVMRQSDERLAGSFTFCDLIGRDRRRWTLQPVRLVVAELQQAMNCGSGPERWMEI